MELAKEIIHGLVNIQNDDNISDETFLRLLEIVIIYICKNVDDTKSVSIAHLPKPDLIKSVIADISCLFIEAARHDYDEENLRTFLCNERIIGQRMEKLCTTYTNNKQAIQMRLESTGNSVPHLVDIEWHLDHRVDLNVCRTSGVPIYNIQIGTRKYNETKRITFTCTIQQLQELVSKFKDITRHIEKISNM